MGSRANSPNFNFFLGGYQVKLSVLYPHYDVTRKSCSILHVTDLNVGGKPVDSHTKKSLSPSP